MYMYTFLCWSNRCSQFYASCN